MVVFQLQLSFDSWPSFEARMVPCFVHMLWLNSLFTPTIFSYEGSAGIVTSQTNFYFAFSQMTLSWKLVRQSTTDNVPVWLKLLKSCNFRYTLPSLLKRSLTGGNRGWSRPMRVSFSNVWWRSNSVSKYFGPSLRTIKRTSRQLQQYVSFKTGSLCWGME